MRLAMNTGDQWNHLKPSPAEFSLTGPDAGSAPAHNAAAVETRARHWAALLTGNDALRTSSLEFAEAMLVDWLKQSEEGIPWSVRTFPEAFQTTRFSNEVKAIENPTRFLKNVSYGLHSGDFSFFEAIERIGHGFAWDEKRLLQWKQGLENLEGVIGWLPSFTEAQDYLSAAFPLGRQDLDSARESLLDSIEEPHRFLEPSARSEFDERFAEFKRNYIDAYFLLHEDALHVTGGPGRDESRVDPVALRNLDMLSELQYTDKSCLNRVKLMAKWIRHNQCSLPLHQILEHYPRCYCNFNPHNPQPAGSAASINKVIQEGLEYFRTILRRCGHLIMLELKSQPIDDDSLKQITAALSDGPMIALKPQTIKTLNRIIARNSSGFLAEIRKAGETLKK